MKKKILFITEALWIGGIETALVNLLNRMDYDRNDVTCLVLRGSLELADRIHPKCRLIVADREKVFSFPEAYQYRRLYHLTEKSENPSRLHRCLMWAVPVIRWAENRLYIRYIRKHMKGCHFDTCVIYSDRTAETAVRAIDADRYLLFYHHGAMRRVYHDEIGYRRAERIVAVSHAVEQKLRAFRPKYAHKMMTIHNLTDVDGIRTRAAAAVPEHFSDDRFHIVSCGRVSVEKGMDLAVEACARLVAMGHENIHWWIIGDGPAMGDVRGKVTELCMEDHVTLLGMKDNPYPYIRRANLYVQPSRFESYGLTIAEAMVLGRPVLSTDTDGARELITPGQNGTLCAIDSEHIAAAVSHLISNINSESSAMTDLSKQLEHSMDQIEKLL